MIGDVGAFCRVKSRGQVRVIASAAMQSEGNEYRCLDVVSHPLNLDIIRVQKGQPPGGLAPFFGFPDRA